MPSFPAHTLTMPAPPITKGFMCRLPPVPAGKSYGFESWDFAADGPLSPETIVIFSVCEGMLERRARAGRAHPRFAGSGSSPRGSLAQKMA